jgi:hypothetical protein
MRTLIILRGPKGSGRAEYIQKLGLDPWSIDQRRVANTISEPIQTIHDDLTDDPRSRGAVKARTVNLLEEKFRRGAFVIFTPCDTGAPLSSAQVSVSDRIILEIAERARRRRYDILVIDFAKGVPENEIAARRMAQSSLIHTHEAPLSRDISYFSRPAAREQIISAGCRILSTVPSSLEDLLAQVPPATLDVSDCRAVVAIGDIHGHSEEFNRMIDGGPAKDTAYIFTGDFVNKGPASSAVLRRLLDDFSDHPHTVMLAGNHERSLEEWALGNAVHSETFNTTALPDFEKTGFQKDEAQQFMKLLKDAALISWNGLDILATHGGLDRPPAHMPLITGDHLQFGVGNASFDVDQAWEDNVLDGKIPDPRALIQVHGHRNKSNKPVAASVGSYNLEGVDSFSSLRTLVLTQEKDHPYRAQFIEQPLTSTYRSAKVVA